MVYASPSRREGGRVRIYPADQFLQANYVYTQDVGGRSEYSPPVVRRRDSVSITGPSGTLQGPDHKSVPSAAYHHERVREQAPVDHRTLEHRPSASSAYHHPSVAGSSRQPQLPENAIYYIGMNSGVPSHHYSHELYGQAGYVDGTYRPGGPPIFASSVYPSTVYGPTYTSAYQNPYVAGSYHAYPQPSPPYRRSRTAPSRTINRNDVYVATQQRRPRGISVDFDRRAYPYRAYIGAGKRPTHLANRRSRVDSTYVAAPHVMAEYPYTTMNRTFNRPRPPSIYQPSYTTYPPTKMQFRGKQKRKYPLWLRASLKTTELILGAAILGLILGPMRNTSFIDFVTRTRTEWQGVVVGIVASLAILTATLLASCFFGHTKNIWRKLDAHISVIAFVLGLLAACIEAYFAACYPPNGARINLVCHRAEWIIATILCFINVVLYVIDFVLSWLAGVTML